MLNMGSGCKLNALILTSATFDRSIRIDCFFLCFFPFLSLTRSHMWAACECVLCDRDWISGCSPIDFHYLCGTMASCKFVNFAAPYASEKNKWWESEKNHTYKTQLEFHRFSTWNSWTNFRFSFLYFTPFCLGHFFLSLTVLRSGLQHSFGRCFHSW